MKFSDLLKRVADTLDSQEETEVKQPKMMTPQTQELELAKKMAGVPSEYDEEEVEVSDCGCGGSPEPEQALMASHMKYPEDRAVTEPTGDADDYPEVEIPNDNMGTGDDLNEPTGDAKKFPKVKEDEEIARLRRLSGL